MTRSPLRSGLRRLYRSLWPAEPVRSAYLAEAFPAAVPHVLLEGESVPTPETATMDIEPFASYLEAPEYQCPEVVTTPLSNALYCPVNDCLMNQNRQVVRETTGPGGRVAGLNCKALFRTEIEKLEGVWTAFRSPFNDFYHFLIDNLSRLDLLHFKYFKQFGTINVFCPGGPTSLESYFLEKLNLPNLRAVDVAPDRLYQPDTYLFISFITRRASGYLRGPFIQRLHQSLHLNALAVDRPPAKKVYISRAFAKKGRQIRNETALMNALAPLGFEAFVLEHLPIEEQINVFRSADCVVAPHGAGLANLIFSKSTRVIELFASDYVVPHFYLLSKSLGHQYTYVLGSQPHHDDNFTVDINSVLGGLDRLLDGSPQVPPVC